VDKQATDPQQLMRDALNLMTRALDLLDRAAAPANVGAHLDLAIHQLANSVGASPDEAVTGTERSGARD
jgi:hypothetical protein